MATTSATSATTGSNIDVASIVSQLMTVEQRPITLLDQKEAGYQAQISAYGTVKGALSSFQTAVSGLNNASKFQGLNASTSDSSTATASATATAVAGTYSLAVTQMAQAQKLVAGGLSSQTAAVGNGTLTFDFGSITGALNPATGKYSGGPTSTVASGAFTAPTSVLNTGTYRLTVDGLDLQPTVTVNDTGTVVTAATLDASLTTFLAAHTGYSKAGSFATNDLVLTKADGTPVNIVTTLGGDTDPLTGTFAGAGFVGTTASPSASFLSNGNGSKTVTIDATNNSLQGIRDAINAANIGVTAAIINDGSANPYRLSLTSSQGVSNSVKISVAGDAALSTLLAHDPADNAGQNLSETATAQNANFTVNGIAVTKASNSVSDVIQGVTLNLLQKTTVPINLSITQSTSGISTAISAFVKAYNDLNTALKSVSSYDPATKTSAILQGDSSVIAIQSQVRRMLDTHVSGAGALTTLSQVGVSFQKDGSLALDTAKLNTAISNNASDIAALFATMGRASDSLISYSSAASTAKPGSYAVHVDSLAKQGISTGNLNLNAAAPIAIIAPTTINVTLDGTTSSVNLTAGTYTAAQLAAMVQSSINGTAAFSSAGSSVAATIDGLTGFMNITSNRYGSASNVSMSSVAGTTVAGFMGAVTAVAGADVAGTIDGVAATGSGQFLTSGGGNSAGLKIQVNGGAFGNGAAGDRGTVSYSQGYAYTLNQLSTSMLSSTGLLSSKTNGLNNSIAEIGKQRDAVNARLVQIQANYTKQYSALDVLLSSMNSTSNYLTQQLAALSNLR